MCAAKLAATGLSMNDNGFFAWINFFLAWVSPWFPINCFYKHYNRLYPTSLRRQSLISQAQFFWTCDVSGNPIHRLILISLLPKACQQSFKTSQFLSLDFLPLKSLVKCRGMGSAKPIIPNLNRQPAAGICKKRKGKGLRPCLPVPLATDDFFINIIYVMFHTSKLKNNNYILISNLLNKYRLTPYQGGN